MDFAGVNYVAILAAAIASMMIGAAWYGGLAKLWMRAAKINENDLDQSLKLYAVAAVCQFVIAFFLAGIISHLAIETPWTGAVTAFFCWLGFVAPTMTVNHRFQGEKWNLTIINAGFWLLVFVVQGAIIGWFLA
ncbi:MAG: hypothetical protein COB78_12485 [Hyphomicrobiales bacterium]|nr:MAG: hypothetical protein COB78_12485 [Hyphomicrobiales bacterium]